MGAIPEATLARLPVYLRALDALASLADPSDPGGPGGQSTTSSGELAQVSGVNPAQVRKDLSYLGSYGVRGVGYDLDRLREEIGRWIGSSHCWPVVVLGIGNLGSAIAAYLGGQNAFRVVGLVDTNPAVVGQAVAGQTVRPATDLPDVLHENPGAIGVIATPTRVAQACADELVRHGVSSILSFAATHLDVPTHVTVRKVDLGQELQILSYHAQHAPLGTPADAATPQPKVI